MNLKKIVNIAFLLYGILILAGVVLLVVFSGYVASFNPSGGGGLALLVLFGILGLGVVSLVGAIAYGVIGWIFSLFFAAGVERLPPQDQKRLLKGLLFTFICTIGYVVMQHYFDLESEESKQKSQFNEIGVKEVMEKQSAQICQVQRGWILGKWKTNSSFSNKHLEYKENNVVRYSEEIGWENEGHWQLICKDMMLLQTRTSNTGIKRAEVFKLLNVGPTNLSIFIAYENLKIVFMRIK